MWAQSSSTATGERIGGIEEVYLNEATERPEWLRVSVGPMGLRSTLVPVDRLEDDNGVLVLATRRPSSRPRRSTPSNMGR